MSSNRLCSTLLAALVLAIPSALLTGCALGTVNLSGPLPVSATKGPALTGTVYGGQQPIAFSNLQLYAAGTSGYGSGATALIAADSTADRFPGGLTGCSAANAISGYSIVSDGTTGTVTITTTAANTLINGAYVTFSGFSATGGTSLNGLTLPVSGSTATTFQVSFLYATSVSNPTDAGSAATTCYQNIVTDANGSFSISNDYTCNGQPVYLVATAGNPNFATNQTLSSTNSSIAIIDAIGPCDNGKTLLNTSSPVTSLTPNEATTVAAVTALQQFMSVTYGTAYAFSIGAPATTYNGVATAQIGMTNAFATAGVLVNSASGTTGSTTTVVPESDHIYEIANILATCVNSTAPATDCTANLFADAKPSGASAAPADTVQAMYAMATNPVGVNANGTVANYVSTLTGLVGTHPQFYPYLSSIADFTIAVGYATQTSGAANAFVSPYGIAIDAYGNAWVSNYISGSSSSIVEVGPTGKLLTGPITSFTASGGFLGGGTIGPTVQSGTTILKLRDVAIDLSNNAWITNAVANTNTGTGSKSVGSVAVLPGSTGTNVTTSTTSATAVGYFAPNGSTGIVIDGSNNVYILGGSTSALNISKFVNGSSSSPPTTAVGTVGTGAFGIAVDLSSSGPYIYATSDGACGGTPFNGQISVFNSSTFTASSTASNLIEDTAGAGASGCNNAATADVIAATLSEPYGIAVDKNNNLWVTDLYGTSGGGGITYLVQTNGATTGSGIVGTTSTSSASSLNTSGTVNGVNEPDMVAVDGNNNAWLINSSGSTVAEFAASTASGSPVLTPLTGLAGIKISGETGVSLATTRQGALDPSGNFWIANNPSGGSAYVTVLVGVAAPVVTPLSQAYKSSKIGSLP